MRVTDADGAPTTDRATVVVNNVAPAISGISGPSQVLITWAIPFTRSATDPSSADTRAGFEWQWSADGGAYSGGSDIFKATFSACGVHSVNARAVDKDGGVSEAAGAGVVTAYDGRYQQPLNEGRTIWFRLAESCRKR